MVVVARKLAFGMEWCTSTSDTRDEMANEAKRLKANVYTEVIGEVGRMYGFAEVKKWRKVRSAAAAVADSLSDGGIFIHRINDDDQHCLIAIDIERRMPVLGMDRVGTRNEVISAALAFIKKQPEYASKVFGDLHVEEIKGAQALTLDRIAADAVISAELKPVRQTDSRIVLGLMCVVAATAVLFSDDISEMMAPAPAAPVVPPAELYRNQVAAAVTEISTANQFPSSVMGGFIPFLASVPGQAAGWHIESLKCVSTDCTAVWKRQTGATSEGFLRALNVPANDPSVTFYDVDYAKRTLSFEKVGEGKKLILAPNSTFSEIVGSWLQSLSDRQLERPTLDALKPLVPENGVQVAPGERPQFATYQFTVPFQETDLKAVANLPDMMTIEQIELSRGASVESKPYIKFIGKYYAL
ncbi:hypothetical protein [Massilia sp. X63]|uniref:hypothetical protein n=1 Tax=Massilia sp. X63 TaxID=3237285 RepID=UPI0034DCDBA7